MQFVRIKLVVIFIFLLGSVRGNSSYETMHFERINHNSGFPSNQVVRIHQDKEGLLWFATRNGLVRYDGYKYSTFRSTDKDPYLLPSNHITSIDDDSTRVWIATYKGFAYYDKSQRIISHINNRELAGMHITKIVIARDHSLWMTSENGVFRYFPEIDSLANYTTKINDKKLLVSAKDVIVDSKDRIWVAIRNGGLLRYNEADDEFIRYPKINKGNSAHILYEDHIGQIWIGTWGHGLVKMIESDKIENTKYICHSTGNSPDNISCDIIYSIAQDKENHDLWIGHRNGLSITSVNRDDSVFHNFDKGDKLNDLSGNDISAVYCDEQGLLWLGSIGGWVNRVNLNKSLFQYNDLSYLLDKVGDNYISAIAKIDEILWIAIKNRGIALYNTQTETYSLLQEKIKTNKAIEDIHVNHFHYFPEKSEMWFGSYAGNIYKIKLKHGQPTGMQVDHYSPKSYIPKGVINKILVDSKNNIWIIAGYGIGILTHDGLAYNISATNINGKTEQLSCKSITEDRNGNIWISTDNLGILQTKFTDNQFHFKEYSPRNQKLNINSVFSLFEDSRGRLWAGTKGGGASLYDPASDRFIGINSKYNIPYDDLFNIIEDANQNIWMCNYYALIKINPTRDHQAEIYSSSDQRWSNIFSSTCHPIAIDSHRYLIGGSDGYNIFVPTHMEKSDLTPRSYISDIEVNNRSIFTSNLQKQYNYQSNNISLPHDNNNISLEFSCIDYSNPQLNTYAYMLKGLSNQWVYVNADQRKVSFTNLDAGKYQFLVKAANDNGLWSEDITTLHIHVAQSPFKSWYAWIIYALLFIASLISVYSMIKFKYKVTQRLRLNTLEKENMENLNQTKLKFFTNISHELLTPLSIINCSVDDMIESKQCNENQLEVMSNNINRLTRLIRQVLEFRKAESDKLKLKVAHGNLSEFIKNICEGGFKPLIQKKQVHFSYMSTPNMVYGWFDNDKLDKILYNLLSNAFKYNTEGGFVHLVIKEINRQDHRYAQISVKDCGEGIPSSQLDKIFECYYDGDYRKFNTQGTGIGLALTKSLTQLHHGTITVESEEGKGSSFTVTIPLDKELYSEEEIEELTPAKLSTNELISENTIEDANRKHLLIVDDNTELLDTIHSMMRRDYIVTLANNGQAALDILKDKSIDLVVSDIMMPIMDGLQLCKKIKEDITFSHIPIILLTAKSSEEDKISAYDNGADGYITKPFKMQLLRSRVANLLSTKEIATKQFKEIDTIKIKEITYTSVDEKFMDKAIEFITNNIDNEDLTFEDFVNGMNVSKSMLYRKIKSLTGMSTGEFIKNIRLKTACNIMREKSVNVAEVAYAVGFSNPKYFTTCFKKEFGILPTEYIKQHSQEVVKQESTT